MNKAKIEMMEALKGLLETYGAEGVFQVLTEATENLVGASNEANECYALSAANEIRKAARAVKRAELKIEASLAGSLEVLIECEGEEEGVAA